MALILDGTTGITTPGLITLLSTSTITGPNGVTVINSTTNSNSFVVAKPNGTGAAGNSGSGFTAYNGSDTSNSAYGAFNADQSAVYIGSTKAGSGTYLPFLIQTGGAERFRIDTSGNVWQAVNGTTTSAYYKFGDASTTYASVGGYYDSSTTGHLEFYTFSTTLQERARIASTGDFLVGKTSTDLTVAGSLVSPTEGVFATKSTTSFGSAIYANRTAAAGDGTCYEWATSGTSRGTISVSGTATAIKAVGTLQIGGGGANNFQFSSAIFSVNTSGGSISFTNSGTGDNRPAYFANSSASGLPNGLLYLSNTNNPNNTTYSFIQCDSGGTKFIVYGNGSVGSATNSYGGISDERIKENIVDTGPKLDDLMQVRIRNYNLIDDPTKLKQLGVVAQELEQVFPGLIDTVEVKDKDGNVLCEDRKSVKYSVFVPMLIKAVQELKTIVDAQQAEIDQLKGAK